MKKRHLRITGLFLIICMILSTIFPVRAETESISPEILAASGILMEVETGKILYEKDSNTRRCPASVTKVMTLLLIFEQLDSGKLSLNDTVTTSAHAKSMGGSQVFLEEGEQQSVETMIKCIVIASGNDASVAMAEHIAGSEQSFVNRMNQRAEELGMKNTHFVDCCGLTDSDEHYTSAYDIALMSRELIRKHPQIFEYSSIWMENITHVTAQGTKKFGLTNTNRLIRTYPGCKGLKTGSTSKAKFCLSAVAERDGLSLLSVVMAAPDYKARLKDASALLDYGFDNFEVQKVKVSKNPVPKKNLSSEQYLLNNCGNTYPFYYTKNVYVTVPTGTDLSTLTKKQAILSNAVGPLRLKSKYYFNGQMVGWGMQYERSIMTSLLTTPTL